MWTKGHCCGGSRVRRTTRCGAPLWSRSVTASTYGTSAGRHWVVVAELAALQDLNEKNQEVHIDMRSINQGRGLTVVTKLSRRLMLLVGTVNSNYMRHNHVLDVGEGKVSS
jgi:hypothetical protein